ncbi:CNH domain-containing protein [Dipodascopsis uninucleata]
MTSRWNQRQENANSQFILGPPLPPKVLKISPNRHEQEGLESSRSQYMYNNASRLGLDSSRDLPPLPPKEPLNRQPSYQAPTSFNNFDSTLYHSPSARTLPSIPIEPDMSMGSSSFLDYGPIETSYRNLYGGANDDNGGGNDDDDDDERYEYSEYPITAPSVPIVTARTENEYELVEEESDASTTDLDWKFMNSIMNDLEANDYDSPAQDNINRSLYAQTHANALAENFGQLSIEQIQRSNPTRKEDLFQNMGLRYEDDPLYFLPSAPTSRLSMHFQENIMPLNSPSASSRTSPTRSLSNSPVKTLFNSSPNSTSLSRPLSNNRTPMLTRHSTTPSPERPLSKSSQQLSYSPINDISRLSRSSMSSSPIDLDRRSFRRYQGKEDDYFESHLAEESMNSNSASFSKSETPLLPQPQFSENAGSYETLNHRFAISSISRSPSPVKQGLTHTNSSSSRSSVSRSSNLRASVRRRPLPGFTEDNQNFEIQNESDNNYSYDYDESSPSYSPSYDSLSFSYSGVDAPNSGSHSQSDAPPVPPVHRLVPESIVTDPIKRAAFSRWSSMLDKGTDQRTSNTIFDGRSVQPARANTTGSVSLTKEALRAISSSSTRAEAQASILYSAHSGEDSENSEEYEEDAAFNYHFGSSSSFALDTTALRNNIKPTVVSERSVKFDTSTDRYITENSMFVSSEVTGNTILEGDEMEEEEEEEDLYDENEIESEDSEILPSIAPLRTSKRDTLFVPDRSHSPAESATSTHADTDVMNRYGLPLSIPDLDEEHKSQVANDLARKIANLPVKPGTRPATARECQLCPDIWLLSALLRWIRVIMGRDADFMPEKGVKEILTSLFMYHIPRLSHVDAYMSAWDVTESFVQAGVLQKSDGHLHIDSNATKAQREKPVLGVLPLLTGGGCYTMFGHISDEPYTGKCYSPICSGRNLVIMNNFEEIDDQSNDGSNEIDLKAMSWIQGVPKHIADSVSKSESERQNVIFEFVKLEKNFLDALRAFIHDFKNGLLQRAGSDRPIVRNTRQFLTEVLSNTEDVYNVNYEYLYKPLLARQKQNMIVEGIGDLILGWIKPAWKVYIENGSNLERSTQTYFNEKNTNSEFEKYAAEFGRKYPTSGVRSVFVHFTRYSLTLDRMISSGRPRHEERVMLERAIREIRELGRSFESRYESGQKQHHLLDLQNVLRFTDSGVNIGDLNLAEKRREIFLRETVKVKRNKTVHIIVLDNYMLVSKIVTDVTAPGGCRYELSSKTAIPMDFLQLESRDHESMSQTSAFGISSVLHHNNSDISSSTGDDRGAPRSIATTRPSAEQLQTQAVAVTRASEEDDRIVYPFTVKHLGRNGEVFTFYTSTRRNRDHFCDMIVLAKNHYLSSRYTLRSEPFSLDVLSDMAFAYESGKAPDLPVPSSGSVLEHAIRAAQSSVGGGKNDVVQPLVSTKVNCAASFYPEQLGFHAPLNRSYVVSRRPHILVGCDYGVYLCDGGVRRWQPVLPLTKVRQIKVVPEYGIAIILSEKTLLTYNLEALLAARPFASVGKMAQLTNVPNKIAAWMKGLNQLDLNALTPIQISGSREASFFDVGVLNGRTVIVSRRRDTSDEGSFRVYEPIGGKLERFNMDVLDPNNAESRHLRVLTMRRNVHGWGSMRAGTDPVRETDTFSVSRKCSGVNILKRSLVLHTNKGFEFYVIGSGLEGFILPSSKTIDEATLKWLSQSDNRPLDFFPVSDQEFLLCYSRGCIFCDRSGSLSRAMRINFYGTPADVAYINSYVLAFDHEFVEIWDINTCTLKQVITGRDVKLLSKPTFYQLTDLYSRSGESMKSPEERAQDECVNAVLFKVAHPEIESRRLGRQLVLRLKANRDMITSSSVMS